jgi:ABC-2 type transport system ATP-binding protein
VPMDNDEVYDRILVAVAEIDVRLLRVDQRRHRVAELFQTPSVTGPAAAQEVGHGAAN